MTTQKTELMPDEVFVCFGGTVQDIPVYVTVIDKGETRRPEIYSSYTRTDLYTAACAERDALRALCEGMAAALERSRNIVEDSGRVADTDETFTNVFQRLLDDSDKALAAYEKHKGVG